MDNFISVALQESEPVIVPSMLESPTHSGNGGVNVDGDESPQAENIKEKKCERRITLFFNLYFCPLYLNRGFPEKMTSCVGSTDPTERIDTSFVQIWLRTFRSVFI